MKKIAINIFICLYVLLTILITYCLLSYNDYNIAELKNKTLLIFENKENNYKKSDLLIVKKNSDITKGEQIFYYDKYDNPVKVSFGKVVNIEKIDKSVTTYTLDNEKALNDDSIIGSVKNTKKYSTLGSIYSTLTSKWGYLIIIILPMLTAFIYEVYEIIKEIKK
ncbi:MAG: hypothetical protein PUB90_02335 [bacterium]|nr:hypothetical protein [bacterium]